MYYSIVMNCIPMVIFIRVLIEKTSSLIIPNLLASVQWNEIEIAWQMWRNARRNQICQSGPLSGWLARCVRCAAAYAKRAIGSRVCGCWCDTKQHEMQANFPNFRSRSVQIGKMFAHAKKVIRQKKSVWCVWCWSCAYSQQLRIENLPPLSTAVQWNAAVTWNFCSVPIG